eukprot:2113542-Amphidinium_carterae.1
MDVTSRHARLTIPKKALETVLSIHTHKSNKVVSAIWVQMESRCDINSDLGCAKRTFLPQSGRPMQQKYTNFFKY